MASPAQWERAYTALQEAVIREIVLDNPAAAPLIRKRLARLGRQMSLPRPLPVLLSRPLPSPAAVDRKPRRR
jgi:hypothetical protein